MRIVTACALLLGCLAALGHAQDAKGTDQDKKSAMRFTIGKETTYVTEPVDKHGYIDYVTALNRRLKQGVTPEKNCCVLLWSAFGSRPDGKAIQAEYFEWLGVAAPPENGDYFNYLKIGDREQLENWWEAAERPWKAVQFSHIANWLKANEKPLDVAARAVQRAQYYSPQLQAKDEKGERWLIDCSSLSQPYVVGCGALGKALTVRALLHVGEGRTDEAWQDLLACHRLARQVARGGSMMEMLVAIGLETIASRADVVFLDGAKLDSKKALECLQDLKRLPAMPPCVDIVDLSERLTFLDAVIWVSRHGFGDLETMSHLTLGKPLSDSGKEVLNETDWDRVLKIGNHWFDRCVAAMRIDNRPKREQLLKQLFAEREKTKIDMLESGVLKKVMAKGGATPPERGKVFGDLLLLISTPVFHRIQHATDRLQQIERNLHVAFALVAYRHDRGAYPKKLDELAPKYLPRVPDDIFTGRLLVYQPSAAGFLLYSFGVNGIDEQGRSNYDVPPCDDLPVRLPLPPPKK